MMPGLGAYRSLSADQAWVHSAGFIGLLVFTAFLERLQFLLRATERSSWWASSGRDVLNALALLGLMFGLRLLGFPGPVALGFAAILVVTISLFQSSLPRSTPLSTLLSVAVSLALGAPLLIAPARLHALFEATLMLLF